MTNLNNAYTFYYNYGEKLFVLLCIRLDIRICNRIRIRPKFFFCICIHIRIRGFYFISIRIRIRIQDKCGRLHISVFVSISLCLDYISSVFESSESLLKTTNRQVKFSFRAITDVDVKQFLPELDELSALVSLELKVN